MAVNTAGIDRALGAIGTTFRLVRLYPPTHPAVQEALRQVASALPALAAMGTLEWKVGATGVHWHGQHLLPRNAQLAELAGLLFARGVRGLQVHPGLTPEHVLALFHVATGSIPPDDPSLGRITAALGRRSSQRLAQARTSTGVAAPPPSAASPAAAAVAPPAADPLAGVRPTAGDFRQDVLPPDVEARRAIAALKQATDVAAQRNAVEKLQALAADLLQLRDTTVVAEAIGALDELLPRASDGGVAELVGIVAGALADGPTVQRMVIRMGEPRVPPAEREALIHAVGALASVTVAPVLDAFVAAPADLREPYRAAVRVAADRAIEPLQTRLDDRREEIVAAVAEFLGLTGSPGATSLVLPLTRHRAEVVRERALFALAELGGREISRPAVPALKDESAAVRAAAARTIGVGGDPSASPLLVRRLDSEEDEGVQAELLRSIGKLGTKEALEVLAKWAEPGGRMSRRTPFVRAAAVEGLSYLSAGEARALLELYRQDKEPAVKRAAEAALK
ncbi:MAG TPA: HEAT repeat domain-containing protein [Gemmatimonadales bacterium]